MNLKRKFSESDLQRIKAAVGHAEEKISGEIVPVIVEKSGYYTIANYKSALVFGSLAFLAIIFFDRYAPNDNITDPLAMFVLVVFAAIVGSVVPAFWDDLRRVLVTQSHMNHATKQRAQNAFMEEEVFNTRHRTGIMIFISFFEREVIVMSDRGISKVVDQHVWDRMVSQLTEQIRIGKMVDGLVAAIERCGEVLLEKGFTKTDDDVNELRDDLRID